MSSYEIMIGSEEAKAEVGHCLNKVLPLQRPFVFACIGTDRATGDCFGPLVGTFLQRKGFKVIGTLDEPLHAVNLIEKIQEVPPEWTVIAVDSCLGKLDSIGKVIIKDGSIKPGTGVNKELPEVGHVAIEYVVNLGGFFPTLVLQCTRLSLVYRGAEVVADGIDDVLKNDWRKLMANLA